MSLARRAFLVVAMGMMQVSSGCRQRAPVDDSVPGSRPDASAIQQAGATDSLAIATPPDGDRPEAASPREPGMLRGVATAPVSGWVGADSQPFEVTVRSTGAAGAHTRRFGTIALGTSFRDRNTELRRYPCTSCHVGRRVEMKDDRIADAHEDLEAHHPTLTGAKCATCHSPDNVELLALKSGEEATLDHVYRICAECHNSEAAAWAAGAHGKRLDGWQGRRVVMGCADCHDPHAPGIGKRIPFKAPRIGGKSH